MKAVEPLEPTRTGNLTQEIRTFWTRNVNAERIMGKSVTDGERGSERYFHDLEIQRYRSHRHLLPWITSMQTGKNVLEIGCGVGLDSFTMARHGLAVTAIDLTEVGVRTARQRFLREGVAANFAAANAEKLPFADNLFDYVYSFGVLHHAADTAHCIDEVYRILKPGGEARVMLYHSHSLNEYVHRLLRVPFEEKDELCPVVRRFTRAEVRRMFGAFTSTHVAVEYLFGEGYGPLFRVTPRWLYDLLSRRIGWHLMITAIK